MYFKSHRTTVYGGSRNTPWKLKVSHCSRRVLKPRSLRSLCWLWCVHFRHFVPTGTIVYSDRIDTKVRWFRAWRVWKTNRNAFGLEKKIHHSLSYLLNQHYSSFSLYVQIPTKNKPSFSRLLWRVGKRSLNSATACIMTAEVALSHVHRLSSIISIISKRTA